MPPQTPVRRSSLQARLRAFEGASGDQVSTVNTSRQQLLTLSGQPIPRRSSVVKEAFKFVSSSVQSPGQLPASSSISPAAPRSSDLSQHSSASPTPIPASARLNVYNDSLPAFSQPQTPQNLPEHRHQSRLLGAVTAPIRSVSPFFARAHGRNIFRSRRCTPSPAGMQTLGFEGLFGGHENGDNFAMFERAARDGTQ
jgi:hypothetical protein